MKRPVWAAMRNCAAVGVIISAAIASSALAATAGGAVSTATYTLKASGSGSRIDLAGTSLIGASSTATAGSSSGAQAQGGGMLGPSLVSTQKASASTPGASQQLAPSCAQEPNPFPAPYTSTVSLGAACSSAGASEDAAGLPTATATGQLGSIALSPSASELSLPVTPGSTVASGLQSVLGTLPSLPTSGTPLQTVLEAVAASASSTSLGSLIDVSFGPTTSSVSATATSATATSSVASTQIQLLQGLGAGGGSLVTISTGASTATATLDRATGKVTASATPSSVSVTVDPPVGTAQSFALAPGQSQAVLSGTPLATTITAGSGTATPGADHGGATATGFSIDAFEGLPTGSGGVDITFGSASATISATPAAVTAAATTTSVPTPTTTPPATLTAAPVTGATTVHTGEYWAGRLPLVLFVLALVGGIGLIARRRVGQLAGRAAHLARCSFRSVGALSSGRDHVASSSPPRASGPARRQYLDMFSTRGRGPRG